MGKARMTDTDHRSTTASGGTPACPTAPGGRDLSAYRANVGLVVFNPSGQVFMGKRVNDHGSFAWQFPQGGIDDGETAMDAAWRELHEETGLTPATTRLLDQTGDWLVYDFPPEVLAEKHKKGRNFLGQKQKWFAFAFDGTPGDIDLAAFEEVEFSAYKWDDLSATPGQVIAWKRDVYREVAKRFAHLAVGHSPD